MLRTNREGAVGAIVRREDFKTSTGNLHGATETPFLGGLGHLPAWWAMSFRSAQRRALVTGAPLYVVRSYATPIAWVVGDAAPIVPDVRYSVTTSRHQGIVRRALGASFTSAAA